MTAVQQDFVLNKTQQKDRFPIKSDPITKEITVKVFNEFVVGLLGPKFYKRLRAEYNRVWVKPIEPWLERYCKYFRLNKKPYFPSGQVRRTWKMITELSLLQRDGIEHVGELECQQSYYRER